MAPGHGMVAAMAAAAALASSIAAVFLELVAGNHCAEKRRTTWSRLLSSCSYDVIRGGSADKGERRSFILGVNGHGDIIIIKFSYYII